MICVRRCVQLGGAPQSCGCVWSPICLQTGNLQLVDLHLAYSHPPRLYPVPSRATACPPAPVAGQYLEGQRGQVRSSLGYLCLRAWARITCRLNTLLSQESSVTSRNHVIAEG